MAAQAKYVMSSTLLLSLLTLAGCNKPVEPQQPKVGATVAPAQAAPPYTPPTAEQLSQMVAPIALFPDKLVGEVLAGATYPAQVTAADQWLAQNPSLKGDALQSAEAGQPWDVSVKSLTAFPSVLDQMAGNIQWTTSLGQAYANDPNDVMNAIQVMRLRAQQAGNLKSSPHLRVSTTVRAAPPPNYIDQPPPDQVVYAGPEIIPPPPQTIIIEPAEPDVVYVPRYNPTIVYGAPVDVYPGWTYREPVYATSDLVTTGAITFGIGILVGAAVSHHYHDSGWNAWGVNWGGPGYGGGGWHRPAVVYNNNTYVTKSVTVINNYHGAPRGPALAGNPQPMRPMPPTQQMQHMQPMRPAGPMTMPHFTAHDAVPGSRQPMMAGSHGPQPQGTAQHDFRQQPGQQPHMAQQMQEHGAPAMRMQAGPQHLPMAQQHQQPGQHQPAQQQHQPGQQQPQPPAQQHQALAQQLAQQREPQMQQHQPSAQQHQAPVQHGDVAMRADAGMPRAPEPHREFNAPERAQAQAQARHQEMAARARPEMAAMAQHPAAQPHAQQPHAEPRHEEHHEQAAHHEQHDKREHHG